ncbi:MAG: hypothetical protein EOO81_07585 [Oxalobacteraceae bacterium]|nr:MAG: hypothetical protein EOO81_07585 [Oxalobacteraceae bacterium]
MLGKDKFMKRAVIAAALMLAGVSGTALAQDPARIDGKPNLNGIWQVMNTANWNLEPHSAATTPQAERAMGAIVAVPAGLGVVEGGVIPYLPEALKKRDELRATAPREDPEAACYLPGVPRATYMGLPFQIVQGNNDDLLMVYEYASANRVINMQEVEVPPIDTWMGTSYGSWEGDTLKVVTLGLSPGDVKLPGGELKPGMTWLDRSGNYVGPHTTVTETFTPRGADHIEYKVTFDDPELYSKPWSISMPIYRRIEQNAQILEFKCVPFSEVFLYGDLLENK